MPQAVDPIHVAVTCDENYAIPLAAMLASLTANLDPRRPLVIHALGHNLPGWLWERLKESVPDGRAQWNCIDVDAAGLREEGFSTRIYDHISPVCYFRLLLPELLPDSVEKVLYLDCDLIIRDDVSSLWETDIASTEFAAVPEIDAPSVKARLVDGVRFHRELGVPKERVRLNSGVLLMNLARWRRSQLAQRVFTYLRVLGDDILWYEQEALNVVANGDYRELDLRWNVPSQWAAQTPRDQVSIVHYLTAHKPWNWDYHWPERKLFFASLDRTPWTGWRPRRPPFGRLRRVMQGIRKARRKRAHELRRAVLALKRDLAYRLIRPTALDSRTKGQALRCTAPEIRLFMAVDHVNDSLHQTLEKYFVAGAHRAFVLVGPGHVNMPGLAPSVLSRTHIFGCGDAPGEAGLRRLLDQFGESHWCVLGDEHGILVDDDGRPVDLRGQCARLDAAGIEVVEAVTGNGNRLAMTSRDLRSGRVFEGTALVDPAIHAYDKPAFRSRAVLLKYRKTMLLDAGAVLSANARKSERCLRFSRPGDSGGP